METYDKKPIQEVVFAKYKIIVPTEKDKDELLEAFEHLHYSSDIDTNFVPVNQLIHEYLTPDITGDVKTRNNIIVDQQLYDKLDLS